MVTSFKPTVRNISKVWRLLSRLEERYPLIEDWFFSRVIPDVESGKRDILVSVKEGKILGLCIINFTRKEISTLYVLERHRGQGIGSALIQEALNKLEISKQDIFISFQKDLDNILPKFLSKFGFSLYSENNKEFTYIKRHKISLVDKTREQQIVDFLIEAGKLGNIKRKIQAIDSKKAESTAAHTYHMALIALVLLEDKLPVPNLLHILKLILVHDLGEVYMGDLPFNKKPSNHVELEENSFKELISFLPENKRNHFLDLWWEYEAGSTEEALYAKAIDKLQPQLVTLSHIEKNPNYKPINNYTLGDCERLLWGYIRDMFPEFEFVIEKIKANMTKG